MNKYSYIKIRTPKSCKDCQFYALKESFEQGCGYTTVSSCVVGGSYVYGKDKPDDCPLKAWKKENKTVIVTGSDGESVEIEDTGEAVPVWYIDDWYTRNKHTVNIQSAIDALHMIGDWRKENGRSE